MSSTRIAATRRAAGYAALEKADPGEGSCRCGASSARSSKSRTSEARQRREQEQQVQAAQEKSRAEAAAKREAARPGAAARATPENARVAEEKRVEEAARSPPQAAAKRAGRRSPSPPASAKPVVVPRPRRRPRPSRGRKRLHRPGDCAYPVGHALPSAAPSLQPAVAAIVTEPAKAAPARTPTEQLADADRATEAKRHADALAILRPLADGGNARAQTRLGDAYVEGRGVPRDDAAAGRWYEKAALQGETGAQVKLATMYAKGNGVLPQLQPGLRLVRDRGAPRARFGQARAGADRVPVAAHRTGAGRQAHREQRCAHGEEPVSANRGDNALGRDAATRLASWLWLAAAVGLAGCMSQDTQARRDQRHQPRLQGRLRSDPRAEGIATS